MERISMVTDHSFGIKGTIDDAVYRLSAIEDILGDEYDLDRLKELLEKDRNNALAPYSKFPEKAKFDYESYQQKQQFYSAILEKFDNGDMTYEQFAKILCMENGTGGKGKCLKTA